MAESPDGKGVIIFGGYNDDEHVNEDRILELHAGANSWNILDILQNGRASHVVIPLQ